MECDLVWYENKVETIVGIHLRNFLGENNFKGVQKPSKKDHLQINSTCVNWIDSLKGLDESSKFYSNL